MVRNLDDDYLRFLNQFIFDSLDQSLKLLNQSLIHFLFNSIKLNSNFIHFDKLKTDVNNEKSF